MINIGNFSCTGLKIVQRSGQECRKIGGDWPPVPLGAVMLDCNSISGYHPQAAEETLCATPVLN